MVGAVVAIVTPSFSFASGLRNRSDESVTIVEWGEGLAEGLAEDRLDVIISRGDGPGEEREVRIVGIGHRWSDLELRAN